MDLWTVVFMAVVVVLAALSMTGRMQRGDSGDWRDGDLRPPGEPGELGDRGDNDVILPH